jgi:hypothetical protein
VAEPTVLEQIRKKLRNQPKAEADAVKWFRNEILNIQSSTSTDKHGHRSRVAGSNFRNQVLNDSSLKSDFGIGSMFLYIYDPKGKETLPFYDKCPLTILTDWFEGGFAGLNLHYLPYKERYQLLTELMEYRNRKNLTKQTIMKLSYDLLKNASGLGAFKPCYHRYLNEHVRTQPSKIYSKDWVTAMFLPVHNFEKKSATFVWNNSLGKI